jgi:superfamily II DNA or RNA helicase
MDVDDVSMLSQAIIMAKHDPALMDVDQNHEGQPALPSTVPRAYQQEILEEAYKRNVIAVLPTGVGKTLIGALLIKKMVEEMAHTETKKVSVWFLSSNRRRVSHSSGSISSQSSWSHPCR